MYSIGCCIYLHVMKSEFIICRYICFCKFLLLTFLFSCFVSSCAQTKLKEAVVQSSYSFNSVFSDSDSGLNQLAYSVGNAKVVMLGEQDHGDGTTFQTKARVISYLHKKYNFDAIVFEGDFFALNNQSGIGKDSTYIDSLFAGNLFRVWSKCQQFSELIKAIKEFDNSDRPLEISGIDIQLYGDYSQRMFTRNLFNYLSQQSGLHFDSTKAIFLKSAIDSVLYYSRLQSFIKDTNYLKNIVDTVSLYRLALEDKGVTDDFMFQVICSLQSQLISMIYRSRFDLYNAGMVRDSQMAENLSWLIKNRFEGKKIIVWAANAHIIKTKIYTDDKQKQQYIPMAYYFLQHNLSVPVFCLGFTSYQGISHRYGGEAYSFHAVEKNSLEEWLNSKGDEFVFVDFRKTKTLVGNSAPSFFMSGGGHRQVKLQWLESYDGVFFIRNMRPCEFKNF
jgi:erythromycin esterase